MPPKRHFPGKSIKQSLKEGKLAEEIKVQRELEEKRSKQERDRKDQKDKRDNWNNLASEEESKQEDPLSNTVTTMAASAVFQDYLQQHGVRTTATDPVAIRLNAIGCSTIDDFLTFDDDKDVDKEMQKYVYSNGTEYNVPRFKRGNFILLWIYSHWRHKTKKEKMIDVPNWSSADWKV